MFETAITVTGRVVSDVTTRMTPTGDKVSTFRIACQERRYDKEQQAWVDGHRMYLGVTGWRRLAEGMGALDKGDQVVVTGRLKISEYTADDGTLKAGPEIDARSVGPDLAWHTVIINRQQWASAEQLSLVNLPSQPSTPGEEVPEAA
jgi:single-strand DNA-binding protein